MNLLPATSDTIVLGISAEKAISLLHQHTQSGNEKKDSYHEIHFIGEVGKDSFSISLKILKPNNFIPLINGRFESTSTGCLLFLNYSLFKSTGVYLIFWSTFTLIASLVALFLLNEVWYAAGAISALLLIQWIAWGNFNLQVKNSRDKLLALLK
jgi:hypothetical protein